MVTRQGYSMVVSHRSDVNKGVLSCALAENSISNAHSFDFDNPFDKLVCRLSVP